MQMTNGEIRTSYKQALHKTEQVKILAELNAVSTDQIIDIICETGEFSRSQFNKAKIKLKKQESEQSSEPSEAPEPKPEPETEITIEQAVARIRAEYDKLTAEINTRKQERHNLVQMLADMMTGAD